MREWFLGRVCIYFCIKQPHVNMPNITSNTLRVLYFLTLLYYPLSSVAGFLRPVVIFGPIADLARDKLGREVPDLFELASEC